MLSMVAAVAILFSTNSAIAQNNYSISGTDEAFENGKTAYLTKYEDNEFVVINVEVPNEEVQKLMDKFVNNK